MTQNPFSFNYITLLQTSTYKSKKIDIKNAGFMRPAITFLNIQLSNSRLSMNKETGKYFVDGSMEESKENIIKDEYEKEIVDFLTKSLHIA